MTMMTLDESTLIAYVDGELDTQTVREVETKLAQDGDARDFVEHLRALSALTRVAFNDVVHAPVPQHLKDAITQKAAAAAPQRPDGAQSHSEREGEGNVVRLKPKSGAGVGRAFPQGLAAAAAVACLFLGLGGGYTYSETTTQKAMQLAALSMQQDQASMEQALNRALEVNISGNALTWQNPDSGRTAAFTPVRTYQDKSGQFCREYRKDVSVNGQKETTYGLACRDGNGTWKTRYLILEDGAGHNL